MRYSTLLTVLATAFALTACGGEKGGATPAPSESTPSAPAAAATNNSSNPTQPVLRVGTDAVYPPFQDRDEKGNVYGIETDLLKAIGKTQGFDVQMEHSIRSKWQETLSSGRYDIWSSAFYQGNQYAEYADMTKPFMEAYIVVALSEDNANNKSITSSSQLQGKKIAVSKYYGQYMLDLAAKLTGSPNNVVVTDTFYLSARELYNNNVDGVLGANYVLAYFANQAKKGDKTRYIPVEGEEPRRLVFLVKKGNQALLDKLNKGIDQAQADGTLKALQDKWLPAWEPTKSNP